MSENERKSMVLKMRKMKDSGIEWIGEIPEGWKTCLYKYCCSVQPGYPFDSAKFSNSSTDGFPIIRIRDITSGEIQTYYTGEYSPNYIVTAGDLLVGMDGDFNVRWWNNDDALLNQRCCRVTEKDSVSRRFLYYVLPFTLQHINTLTYATTVKHLANGDILNSFIAFPPLSVQKSIACYLDKNCSNIDSILFKTRSSIEEYKKLKQAVITQAVTKGVRGEREMKDSGVEWIGEIPAEWSVQRIKTIFSIRNERNYLPLEQVNLISLYTDKGVIQHCDIEKTTGNKASNADGYKKVYPNDMIVNIILCWMGAIGRSDYAGVTSPAYDVYVPSSEIECKFYHYYFRTLGFSGDCYKNGRGIMAMRWRTYSDQFRNIKVVVPSLNEQKEIVDYLDAKCAEIDGLIAKKEQLVKELESYKKSLIYEVVTGKREV